MAAAQISRKFDSGCDSEWWCCLSIFLYTACTAIFTASMFLFFDGNKESVDYHKFECPDCPWNGNLGGCDFNSGNNTQLAMCEDLVSSIRRNFIIAFVLFVISTLIGIGGMLVSLGQCLRWNVRTPTLKKSYSTHSTTPIQGSMSTIDTI